MEPVEYHGASYVADYLGVSLTSIHNWRDDPTSKFPVPVAFITGRSGARAAYGWASPQLSEMRAWFAQRMRLTDEDAAARWEIIDASLDTGEKPKKDDGVCPGQLLISIPVQRNGEAA
jgi:hypothetical protein